MKKHVNETRIRNLVIYASIGLLSFSLTACAAKAVADTVENSSEETSTSAVAEEGKNTTEARHANTTEAIGTTAATEGSTETTDTTGTVAVNNGNTGNTGIQPAAASNPGTTAPATAASSCSHTWTAQTETVHHDETGRVEVTTHWYRSDNGQEVTNEYKNGGCVVLSDGSLGIKTGSHGVWTCTCGQEYTNHDELLSHQKGGNPDGHLLTGHTSVQTRTEPDYVSVYSKDVADFVVVTEAWDETVTTGYACSKCGATKPN